MTRRNVYRELGSDEKVDELVIETVYDGTRTTVEIVGGPEWGRILYGRGSSQRRSGDKRNVKMGYLLALRRALADASEHVGEDLKRTFPGYQIPDA